MTRKGNLIWRFIFSLMPGAGEMYMGFMKRGVSTMLLFLGIFGACVVTDIKEGLVLLPVVWFYSFFTVMNLADLPDEEFYQQDDHYILLNAEQLPHIDRLERGKVRFFAAALIVVGAFAALSSFWRMIWMMFPALWDIAMPVYEYLPNMLIALLLVVFGVYLIRGKKKKLDEQEENLIHALPAGEPAPSEPKETEISETP